MKRTRDRQGTGPSSDLDRFVSEENIKLYRKLLDAGTDEAQRRTIMRLLAEQMASLRKA